MKKTLLFTTLAILVTSSAAWSDNDNNNVVINNYGNEHIQQAPLPPQPERPIEPQHAPPSCYTPSQRSEYTIQSLLDSSIYAHGGYGGFGMKVTQLDGKLATMTGGRGAWIINHTYLLGGGGYGTTGNRIKRTFEGTEKKLDMGYGGLELGMVLASDQLLHLSIQALIGGGGIGYTDKWQIGYDADGDEIYEYEGEHDAFFVFEPMAYLELNVTTWFRVAAGWGYRFVEGVELAGVNDNDLQGSSVELLFKFGSF